MIKRMVAMVLSTMIILQAVFDRTSGAIISGQSRGLRTHRRSSESLTTDVLQSLLLSPIRPDCPLDHCLQLLKTNKKAYQRQQQQRPDGSSSDLVSAVDTSTDWDADATSPDVTNFGSSSSRSAILARRCIVKQQRKCDATMARFQTDGNRGNDKRDGARVEETRCSIICRRTLLRSDRCQRCLMEDDEVTSPEMNHFDRATDSSDGDVTPVEFQIARDSLLLSGRSPADACRTACSLLASAEDAVDCIRRECSASSERPSRGGANVDGGQETDDRLYGENDDASTEVMVSAKRWGNRVGRRSRMRHVTRLDDEDAENSRVSSAIDSTWSAGDEPRLARGVRSIKKRWADRICVHAHCGSLQHSRLSYIRCGQQKCKEGRRR